jgi:hypothetical protein
MTLKLLIHSQPMGQQLENKLAIHKRISQTWSNYHSHSAVRGLVDSFEVFEPDGSPRCLVHLLLLERVLTRLHGEL